MELDKILKDYIASIEIPEQVYPEAIKDMILQNSEMTAGTFLKSLKQLKISGSEFLELLGNSKIGNAEYRRIEENPHLKFDELLEILDNSALTGDDYRMLLAAATHRRNLREERRRREEEAVARLENDRKKAESATEPVEEQPAEPVAEQPAEPVAEQPAEPVEEQPAEPVEEQPAEPVEEQPAEPVEEQSAEPVAEQPAEPVEEQPAEPVEEQPTEPVEESPEKVTQESPAGVTQESPEKVTQESPEKVTQEQPNEDDEYEEYDENDEDDWEYEEYGEDDDYEYDDEDYSAEAIGNALEELVDENGEPLPSRRSRPALIAAFILAAIVIMCGVGYKLLKYYNIIPTYTYTIPQTFSQQITTYAELAQEVSAAENTVGYALPERSKAQPVRTFGESNTAIGKKFIIHVTESDGKKAVDGCGIGSDGKTSETFTADVFDFEPEKLNVYSAEAEGIGYFILTAEYDGETYVKIYEEEALSKSEQPVADFGMSGSQVGFYIGDDAFYPITYVAMDVDKANSEKPETFVPGITSDGRTRAMSFNDIMLPYAAARFNYYVTARIPFHNVGDSFVKSVAVGNSCGFAVGGGAMFCADYTVIGPAPHTHITRIAFDGSLTPSYAEMTEYVNPTMLAAGNKHIALPGPDSQDAYTLYVYTNELSGPTVMEGLAKGQTLASDSCTGDVITLITDGNEPVRYDIDLTTMKSASPAPVTAEAEEGVYSASAQEDKVQLTLTSPDGKTLASADITAQGGSNWRIPAQTDTGAFAVSGSQGNTVIGLPVIYFDGVTDVYKYEVFTYSDGKLTENGSLILMEGAYQQILAKIYDKYILTVWDGRVITADTAKVEKISDTAL